MKLLILMGISLLLSSCMLFQNGDNAVKDSVGQKNTKPATKVFYKIRPIVAVGYGYQGNYKDYPLPQQRLLAIRAAKLDAYRNIAEELYGTRIKSNTTVKDMAIENDSYRAYVDAVVRGAHLLSIMPKGDGIYEAEMEIRVNDVIGECLAGMSGDCQQYQAEDKDMSLQQTGGAPAGPVNAYPQIRSYIK